MQNKLTILIVTKDRYFEYQRLLHRLKYLPGISKVNIDVYDNSDDLISSWKQDMTSEMNIPNLRYFHLDNFIDCRNQSIQGVTTDYFMILDDDDYLLMTSIYIIEYYINKYPDVDFFSYYVAKEGRIEATDDSVTIASTIDAKLKLLNDFRNYEVDRLSKVYLWNCGLVIKTSLARQSMKWKYKGCDDILPITDMYLRSTKVARINTPVYCYYKQNTVMAVKSIDMVLELEESMYRSYLELINYWVPNDGDTRSILYKAIRNSKLQLETFDKFNSPKLELLLNNLKSCIY